MLRFCSRVSRNHVSKPFGFRKYSDDVSSEAKAVLKVLEIAKSEQLCSTTPITAAEACGRAMWHLNRKSKFELVSTAFDVLPDEDSAKHSLTVHAAMLANAELNRSVTVKNIMENKAENISPETVSYLMHSYAKDDRLGSAERLMHNWLVSYMKLHPEDELTSKITEKFGRTLSVKSDKGREDTESQFAAYNLGQEVVPLSAWVSMVMIYTQRSAWQQCWNILTYLENMRSTKGLYAYDAAETLPVIIREMNELQSPTYRATTAYLTSTANPQPVPSDWQTGIQWSTMYHLTLRALCTSQQFPLALHLVRRMRESAVVDSAGAADVTAAQAVAQVPAVIALMRVLLAPVIPSIASDSTTHSAQNSDNTDAKAKLASTVHTLAEGKQLEDPEEHTDAYQSSITMRRELAASLRPEITRWLLSSAEPEPRKRSSRRRRDVEESAQDRGFGAEGANRVSWVMNTLAREYVLLLCRLDLLQEAKIFVKEILQRVLKIKHSSEAEYGRICDVRGFRGFSWLSPYIQCLREAGEWKEANALFQQIRDLEAEDEAVLEDEHTRSSRRIRNALQKPSVAKEYIYHNTAAALRSEGKIGKLADLMAETKK